MTMMMIFSDVTLRRVHILPKYLCKSDFIQYVKSILKKKFTNNYEEGDGLTIKVCRLVDIIDSEVSRIDGKIWLNVEFERIVFRPVKGHRLHDYGTITNINDHGAFVIDKDDSFTSFIVDCIVSQVNDDDDDNNIKKQKSCSSSMVISFANCECKFTINDQINNLVILDWEYKLIHPRRLYCIVNHLHESTIE